MKSALTDASSSAFHSCLNKQRAIKELFKDCLTQDQQYQKIIELGRSLAPFSIEERVPEHLVPGCQSIMYLASSFVDEKIYFTADSEALISKGLAALLLSVYNGETPEVILTCPPLFLEQLDIPASLTPSRANGLASLFLQMKKHALIKIK